MNFKKYFYPKDFLFALALVLVGVVLVSPKFFGEKKEISSVSTPSASETTKDFKETTPETSIPEEAKEETPSAVQGVTAQPTSQKTTTPPAPQKPPPTPTTNPNPTPQPQALHQITLTIDNGTSHNYKVSWTSGMKVYDVLVKGNQEHGFAFPSQEWYGAPLNSYYVTNLHGYACECWVFKVNDACSAKGASNVHVNENDIILWSVKSICS